jgi:hypothetical protein
MLGTDKSRGYWLEMICSDFLAGASLDNGDPSFITAVNVTVLQVFFLATKENSRFTT